MLKCIQSLGAAEIGARSDASSNEYLGRCMAFWLGPAEEPNGHVLHLQGRNRNRATEIMLDWTQLFDVTKIDQWSARRRRRPISAEFVLRPVFADDVV